MALACERAAPGARCSRPHRPSSCRAAPGATPTPAACSPRASAPTPDRDRRVRDPPADVRDARVQPRSRAVTSTSRSSSAARRSTATSAAQIAGTRASETEQAGVVPGRAARPRRRDHPADRDRCRPHHPGRAIRRHRDRVARRTRADGCATRARARCAVGRLQRHRRGESRRVAPRQAIAPEFLSQPSDENPMYAAPYTKWHCSQWNVDQASAFVLCSAEAADALGRARDERGCSRSQRSSRTRWCPCPNAASSTARPRSGRRRATHRAVRRRSPRRRPHRPLQLLPLRRAGAGGGARHRPRPPAHRDRRDGVRGRPARQLQLPGPRQDGRGVARASWYDRAGHLHQRDDHEARHGAVVDRAARRRLPLRRRVRRDVRADDGARPRVRITTARHVSTGTRCCTRVAASPSAPSSSPRPTTAVAASPPAATSTSPPPCCARSGAHAMCTSPRACSTDEPASGAGFTPTPRRLPAHRRTLTARAITRTARRSATADCNIIVSFAHASSASRRSG